MIYIFNFTISVLLVISMIIIYFNKNSLSQNYYKKHFIIFIVKLLFISMFIYFFIFNLSISNYKIFIISGYINFTFFHIIEGFINQKILLKNEKKK